MVGEKEERDYTRTSPLFDVNGIYWYSTWITSNMDIRFEIRSADPQDGFVEPKPFANGNMKPGKWTLQCKTGQDKPIRHGRRRLVGKGWPLEHRRGGGLERQWANAEGENGALGSESAK